MPTQQELQQQIQGWVPNSGMGGGNPNTAYNNSPATIQQGGVVPTTDAFGNWVLPTVTPAASITPQGVPVRSTTITPAQFPALNIQPQQLGGWVPPTGTQTPLFPNLGGAGNTPGGSWGITKPGNTGNQTVPNGSTTTPPTTTPTTTTTPPAPSPTSGGGNALGGVGDFTHQYNNTQDPFMRMATVTYDPFGNPTYDFTKFNNDSVKAGAALENALSNPQLGAQIPEWLDTIGGKVMDSFKVRNPNGTFDWKQLADVLTEFAGIKGDIWLAGSEKWDASNAIAGLVQGYTGIPANKIMTALGTMAIKGQNGSIDLKDYPWYSRWLADHVIDNRTNDLINEINQGKYSTKNMLDSNIMAKYFEDTYNALYTEDLTVPDSENPWLKDTTTDYNDAYGYSPLGDYNWLNSRGSAWDGSFGNMGWNGPVGGGIDSSFGCVVVDSFVKGMPLAGKIKVGDMMPTVDPITQETLPQEVTYAETKNVPCVRITTESGVVLDCSETAPIADVDGNQVLSVNLLGVLIPTQVHGILSAEKVVSVESIGNKDVRHITCGNKFFLAGKEEGKYLYHHNIKQAPTPASGTSGRPVSEWDWFWKTPTGGE